MPELLVRPLEGDEKLQVMYDLTSYSLDATPSLPNREDWFARVGPRQGVTYMVLFEDGEAASGAAATTMIENVRGRLYAAHGVWGVATAPAFRRKGYCRQTIAALLAAGREEGQVFSTLYPFRESFYERLGYVTFPLPRIARFAPSVLTSLLRQELEGRVEVALIGERFDEYVAYLGRLRGRTHGMGVFTPPDAANARRNRFWLARAVINNETVGLILYSLVGEEETKFLLRATRFYYDSPQARYLLLQWIARHVDQADRVEMWLAPAEQPELWRSDMQIKVDTAHLAPMGRVVDVERISGMPTGQGAFTAHISDPICPWNNGIWQFESADGLLRVKPARTATCNLTSQGLGSLVYGTVDPGEFELRGWGDPSPTLQSTLRNMFPPLQPHLHERF